jgi:hypothetical protein
VKTNVRFGIISCTVFVLLLIGFDRSIIWFAALRSGFGVKKEEQRIKNTLKLYNSCYADFYDSGGKHEKLNDFPAVTPVKHELFRDLGFLAENQRIMIYDAAEQKVLKLAFPAPGQAEAEVYEEWNYLYQKLKDRKPFTKVRGIGQGFNYKLRRVKGRWVVQEWEPVEVKQQVDNNEFYF